MDDELIRNKDIIKQIVNFKGLNYERGIWPTDIDFFIDFDNKIFIIGELKYKEIQPDYGQRLALERLCDACTKSGIKSYLMIASHDCAKDKEILACDAIVKRVRRGYEWKDIKTGVTVKELIHKIKKYHNVK